jgi:hypothetical protein
MLGRDIRRSAFRHYAGRLFATFASLQLRLPVYDTQCGAKIFRATPEVVALFGRPFRLRWCFDVEVLSRFDALAPTAAVAHASSTRFHAGPTSLHRSSRRGKR